MQVWHDILGLYDEFTPRHTRRFAALADEAARALTAYDVAVRERSFPAAENSAGLDEQVLAAALTGAEPEGAEPDSA